MNLAIPRRLAHGFLPLATFGLVILALVFGGGTLQGRWSDSIVELASLALLACIFLDENLSAVPRAAVALICLLVALPLLQLIPLPPALWTLLPGREDLVRVFSDTGQSLPWRPVSLYPNITWLSALSLLPPVSIFLAMLCLPFRWRRVIVRAVLVFVFVTVLLDFTQMLQGQFSPLRFYASTNNDRAVGFFANSNHNAALLYCAIPFAAAWGLALRRRPLGMLLVGILLVAVIMGLAVAQSRTGLLLFVLAGLLCVGLVMRDGSGKSRRRSIAVVVGANFIALLIVFQFGYISLTKRMQDADIISDLRWPVTSVTLKAAKANLPFGSGFGTFVPVYQAAEPQNMLFERFMNRAHDDWLELLLEGGLPSVIGLLVFLAWFAGASVEAWRARTRLDVLEIGFARASSIVILLLMLHSVVDYPLRTTGIAVLFAIACSLLMRAPVDEGDVERRFVQK